MEKKLGKRKLLRRKYKHYVAALAGAAIMAGALHGAPLAKVSAAENPATPSAVTVGQGLLTIPDTTSPIVVTDPSAEKQVVQGKDNDQSQRTDKREHWGNRHDRHDRHRFEWRRVFVHRMERYNELANKIQIASTTNNPVDVVRMAAADLGFNVYKDTFSLLSQNGTQSIVTVIHHGHSYNVTIDQLANGNWRISFINPLQ